MNTLKLEMENCYGIQKIQQDIDFSKNNVAVIYAPNGTMKSSFAKNIWKQIRDGKTVEEKKFMVAKVNIQLQMRLQQQLAQSQ